MKKEIKEFNEKVKSLVDLKDSFEEEKWFFEKKVEENLGLLGRENFIISEKDHYQLAYTILFENPELVSSVLNVREQHPRYGKNRLKYEVVKNMIGMADEKETIEAMKRFDSLTKLVNTYLLYEESGVIKVLEKQTLLHDALFEVDELVLRTVDDSINLMGNSVKKTKEGLIGLVKPYGEIAKLQISQLESKTKTMVNKGSKKLVKVFETVAKKTEEK